MVKRRRAEVQVSTLPTEQRRELVQAKDKELKTNCQVLCGRGGIASRNLTDCLDEHALGREIQGGWSIESTVGGARLHGPRTRQDSHILSNRIPSIASDFSDTCCVIWLSNSQRRREVCVSSRLLDEQRVGDNDDDDFKIESAQPVSDTCCERVPELSRKLQLEHHQCVRLL